MAETRREKAEDSAEGTETKENVFKEATEYVRGLKFGTPEFEAFQAYVNRCATEERRLDLVEELVIRREEMASGAKTSDQKIGYGTNIERVQSDIRLVEAGLNRILGGVESRVGVDAPYAKAMATMKGFERRMAWAKSTIKVHFQDGLEALLESKYEEL